MSCHVKVALSTVPSTFGSMNRYMNFPMTNQEFVNHNIQAIEVDVDVVIVKDVYPSETKLGIDGQRWCRDCKS